jgi:DNA-binding transcriptional MerR regulator
MGIVNDDEELPIGRFARLSGLSVHTLRHYDDVGLLIPTRVDEGSGYRLYRRDQLPRARAIRALRYSELSLDQVREVLDHPERRARILSDHRTRLERAMSAQAARIADVERLLTEGIPMTENTITLRPVQIKLRVDDIDAAYGFYADAFGIVTEVTRRTEEDDVPGYVFGNYGTDGFFLIHFVTSDEFDAQGPSTIGFLVPDLDAAYSRARDAGAEDFSRPSDREGMPRSAAVRDPSGNIIWLYQG